MHFVSIRELGETWSGMLRWRGDGVFGEVLRSRGREEGQGLTFIDRVGIKTGVSIILRGWAVKGEWAKEWVMGLWSYKGECLGLVVFWV